MTARKASVDDVAAVIHDEITAPAGLPAWADLPKRSMVRPHYRRVAQRLLSAFDIRGKS